MGTNSTPEWLKEEVADYYVPLASPPETVLDIGASTGPFAKFASEKWPDCKITAFEPNPDSAELFRSNCLGPRFKFEQKAVRNFCGKAEMLVGKIPFTTSFFDLKEQTEKRIEVDCIDALILESHDLVKLDTEGCEPEILSRLSLCNTKAIVCEYHRSEDEQFIRNFCHDRGFELIEKRHYWVNRGLLKFVRNGQKLIEPKTKLFIGLPIYGQIDPHFFCSAMKLMAEFSVNCRIKPLIGDSLIPRARNSLTMEFLKSDCTHMLMIDSDLVFSTDHIRRILSHNEDVIGGFYPKKKEGEAELVCNALDPQPPMDETRRVTEMKYIGSGFICVSRRVFEKMIQEYGNAIAYISDHDGETMEYDFWPVGPYRYPNGFVRYLSEDWYFCQRCRDLGFKVYGDNSIILRHSGNAVYPLSYQEQHIFRRVPSTASSDSVPPVTLSPAPPVAAIA